MSGAFKAVLAVILAIVVFRIVLVIAHAVLNLVIPLAFLGLTAWLLYKLINRTFSPPQGRPFH
ncbi:MAG: hypothetical protein N2109_02985 [Fimbriimonadales bacterium]|nr:hypothetical protein [Fimbriimonadales bacterium]